MTWDAERAIGPDGLESVHAFEVERPDVRYLVYRIDSSRSIVEFYPKPADNFIVDKILLEGFKDIPPEFAEAGYMQAGVSYYLNKKLHEVNAIEFTISRTRKDSVRKARKRDVCRLVLSYASFQQLKKALTTISTHARQDRSAYVDDFFYRLFPTRYRKNESSPRRQAKRLMFNLDERTIKYLTASDVKRLLDFVETLLATKYKKRARRRELFGAAKVKVDEVALADVITTFERMLAEKHPESDWGDFLKKNLFLVESKYIKVISELNVVLASARKVDFGLVDSQGYLDLFEIKKPTTQILAKRQDRGNYYWSTDAIKALVQAEKYLYNAIRKAPTLAEDISRERGIEVRVVRPRAVVIMGTSGQLDCQEKEDDCRILRTSLKNIEVILYDELLERLKNQQSKIYVDTFT